MRNVIVTFSLLWAVMAGADTLIVLNKSEATASLVDLVSGKVAKTVATGEGPHEVAVTSDGTLALVTNYGAKEPGSTLTLIDIAKGTVIRTIDLGNHRRPHGVRWLSDNRSAVVTAEESKALLVVDTEGGAVKKVISTDQEVSHMVVVSPDGKKAFVANIGSGSVTAVDLVKGVALTSVSTGAGAEGIALTPDAKQLWVTNREADTITVMDPETLSVVTTLHSRSFPIRAQSTPDGKFVLVSNAKTGEVAVFDTALKKEIRRLKIPLEAGGGEDRLFGSRFGNSSVPIGISIPPDGKRAYVANSNADAISILDLEEWKVVGALKAGREPDGLGYSSLSVK